MQLVLKSADISNPAKPLPIVKNWTGRVIEEFFNQGRAMQADSVRTCVERANVFSA
jgi:hypothetical protein